MDFSLDLKTTLTLCAVLLAIGLFAGWRGARPADPHRGVRMVPWRFIMLVCAAILLPMLTHLAVLLGLIRSA